jgi:hypothetical protein
MPREKNLRGMLRSAVDRAVSRDSIVIVDSLNNIKVSLASTSPQSNHPSFVVLRVCVV